MNILKGILSLQEAMNSETLTAPSINPHQLELLPVEPHYPKAAVSDNLPRYTQRILYGGCKLMIQVPAVKLQSLLYKANIAGESVIVPVENWLRHQFSILDIFISENVTVPPELRRHSAVPDENLYKDIYNGKNLCMKLGRFCRFTQMVGDQLVDIPCIPRPNFGVGRYSFSIEIPYVYIGPHKSGALYSLTMMVTRIHFEPQPPNEPYLIIQRPVIPSNVQKTIDQQTVSQSNVQPIVSQSNVQPIVSQSTVQPIVSQSNVQQSVSFPRVQQQTMNVSSETMMTTPMSELFPIIKQAEAVKPKRRSKFSHSQ